MTIIRHAVEADLPRLHVLMRDLAVFERYIDTFAVTEEVLSQQGFHKDIPDFYALVAEQDAELAGMLVYYFIPFTATAQPTLYMKELYVQERVRGQGVGEELMRAAAQQAVRHGCGAMKWTVADWNTAGQRFYERLGASSNPVWIDYGLSREALNTLASERTSPAR